MPKLGLLMETGTVGAWKVAEGDQISVGQVIAEITTEKIVYELESQAAGVLLKILLPDDGEAPVGESIGIIGRPGEDISAFGGAAAAAAPVGAEAPAVAAAEPAAAPVRAPGERVVASPAAKKLASELGIDIAVVAGSGPGGRVTLEDVNAAAAQPAAPAAGAEAFATPVAKKLAAELGVDLAGVTGSGPSGRVKADDVTRSVAPAAMAAPSGAGAAADIRGGVLQEIPYSGMRKMIGEHMDASRTIAPTVTYSGMADVQKLKELIAQINLTRPDDDRVNITAATVKAVALTLERMPKVNSTLDGNVIKVWRNINVGVAVALNEGLIVPVIREANRKRLSEIAREIKELAGKARDNKLLPDDISGGTFTVSTLGPYRSVDFFSPIINQPESAILGVGRMADTVVAVDGEPVVHATMGLAVTCDHRVIDGAPAAEFLKILMDYLAEPFSILV